MRIRPGKLVGFVAGAVVVAVIGVVVERLLQRPEMQSRIDDIPHAVASFWPIYAVIVGVGVVWLLVQGGFALRESGRDARQRARAIEMDQSRSEQARRGKAEAWDRVGPYFLMRASEMASITPEIAFMLPPRAAFDPENPWPLVGCCSRCEDHPALLHGITPGIGDGLCCSRCKTVYSERQPGVAHGDAARAILRKLGKPVDVSFPRDRNP